MGERLVALSLLEHRLEVRKPPVAQKVRPALVGRKWNSRDAV